jgi:hypothetical protein
MQDNNFVSLSAAFIAEASDGNFHNVVKILDLIPKHEINHFLGHVSFEIHQFTNEILADSKNFQKCHEYFHEKRREVKRDDLI